VGVTAARGGGVTAGCGTVGGTVGEPRTKGDPGAAGGAVMFGTVGGVPVGGGTAGGVMANGIGCTAGGVTADGIGCTGEAGMAGVKTRPCRGTGAACCRRRFLNGTVSMALYTSQALLMLGKLRLAWHIRTETIRAVETTVVTVTRSVGMLTGPWFPWILGRWAPAHERCRTCLCHHKRSLTTLAVLTRWRQRSSACLARPCHVRTYRDSPHSSGSARTPNILLAGKRGGCSTRATRTEMPVQSMLQAEE
jgi:hypothetical protein